MIFVLLTNQVIFVYSYESQDYFPLIMPTQEQIQEEDRQHTTSSHNFDKQISLPDKIIIHQRRLQSIPLELPETVLLPISLPKTGGET